MSGAIDISPKKDNGVLKEIIKEGTGDELPCPGCTVTVHYTGTLLDGTKFDSSKDRNEPFSFELGRSRVIKAWEIGIATMKKGEIAILTCAHDYAYGSAGNPPKIPPSATLKFEIEMISWQLEDLSPEKDGSILRQQVTQSHSQHSPKEGALVQIHLIGKYNDQVFEDREVKFCLGEGEEHDIIEGVEKALGHFKSSEKSKLFIKSKYAFKDKGNAEFNIPPHADVEYIVELKEFESSQEPYFLPEPEKIKQAKIFKEKGTNFFKQEKYNLAIKQYSKMEQFLKHHETDPPSDEIKEEKQSLLLSSHLNLAICYLKISQHVKAKDACNEALQIDHANVKALFRRGQAYLGLASPELAIKDFQEVLKIEPNNAAAMKKITACNNLIKEHVAKEKKLYANMFEKFARQDKQREEEKLRQQPDVMREALGEWGQEERPGGRDATAFEKENPNILMLNANGTGEFQNM